MQPGTETTESAPQDVKQVPQDESVRLAVRARAALMAEQLDKGRPLAREELERLASSLLEDLGLPHRFLGYAMVALNNAFWQPQFEAVEYRRRLLFLPACLRDIESCRATIDVAGLNCVGCRRCVLRDLKGAAEELGSRVLIAEGNSGVLTQLLERDTDAVIGVACLDSLEKAFSRAVDLGIPHIAVPLLKDGCRDTSVETGEVLSLLRASRPAAPVRTRTYVPLLREARRIFSPEALPSLLESALGPGEPASQTDAVAIEWAGAGGKRFRPFITLAAYAVSAHGPRVLSPDVDLDGLIPRPVKTVAVAIEMLHKASLVHDDIEDDDSFRYGRRTLHREHGLGPAVNLGDYLVGLGYRLIAAQRRELGSECAADILDRLSEAHLDLCRGQGAELFWRQERKQNLRPLDALSIYALKTAPAFEASLYAGLRAAGAKFDDAALRKFTVYLGEAYQIHNDLQDWREDKHNKVRTGLDALTERPTILRALATEAGAGELLAQAGPNADKVRQVYAGAGVFRKAEALAAKLRSRALDLAEQAGSPGLRDLMQFVVRTVL